MSFHSTPATGRWEEEVDWQESCRRLAEEFPDFFEATPADFPGLTFPSSKFEREISCEVPGQFDLAALAAGIAKIGANSNYPLAEAVDLFSSYDTGSTAEDLEAALFEFTEGLECPGLYEAVPSGAGLVKYVFRVPTNDPDDLCLILATAAATLLAHPDLARATGAVNICVA